MYNYTYVEEIEEYKKLIPNGANSDKVFFEDGDNLDIKMDEKAEAAIYTDTGVVLSSNSITDYAPSYPKKDFQVSLFGENNSSLLVYGKSFILMEGKNNSTTTPDIIGHVEGYNNTLNSYHFIHMEGENNNYANTSSEFTVPSHIEGHNFNVTYPGVHYEGDGGYQSKVKSLLQSSRDLPYNEEGKWSHIIGIQHFNASSNNMYVMGYQNGSNQSISNSLTTGKKNAYTGLTVFGEDAYQHWQWRTYKQVSNLLAIYENDSKENILEVEPGKNLYFFDPLKPAPESVSADTKNASIVAKQFIGHCLQYIYSNNSNDYRIIDLVKDMSGASEGMESPIFRVTTGASNNKDIQINAPDPLHLSDRFFSCKPSFTGTKQIGNIETKLVQVEFYNRMKIVTVVDNKEVFSDITISDAAQLDDTTGDFLLLMQLKVNAAPATGEKNILMNYTILLNGQTYNLNIEPYETLKAGYKTLTYSIPLLNIEKDKKNILEIFISCVGGTMTIEDKDISVSMYGKGLEVK